jgi:chorismate-pyruvate lyase
MLDDFYQTPEQTSDWYALRSEGYLGDARIQRPNGGWLMLEDLPPLLRTLLVTDGTVTKVLEAYFWESVEVKALHLDVTRISRPIPWLTLAAGQEVLTRRVELTGARTHAAYAEAFSVVTLAEFDPPLREALVRGSVGIGVLLRESGLETYREIVAVGAEGGLTDAHDLRVHRTYRIMRDGKPVILIRESFPWSLYRSLPL